MHGLHQVISVLISPLPESPMHEQSLTTKKAANKAGIRVRTGLWLQIPLVIVSLPATCVMTTATEEKVLATNRAAFHNYHISTKYEAGAALLGTEVKSVLDGRIQLKESYVGVRDGEVWLFNAHISPYSHGNRNNHDPLRTRKLLLHRREIDKLEKSAQAEGMTLVITRVYIKSRKIKFEVGVAKGKKLYDKRETEMRKIIDRETRAQLKQRNR